MFMLKKLITPFLLPPGVFVSAAVAAAVIFALFRRRRSALRALLAGVVLWLPGIQPVSDFLLRGLVSDIPGADAPLAGDVIVVLGGGIDDRATDALGKQGALSEAMARRLVAAVQLQRHLELPVLVTGGAPLRAGITEAAVAARHLADLGVDPKAIITETRARDTAENARYVTAICRQRGFRRLLLLSSTHHLKRSVMAFEGTGLFIRPVGDVGTAGPGRAYRWNDFLPDAYDLTARYLHEYLGMLAYRLMG